MVEHLMIAQCTYTTPDTIAHTLLLFFFQNSPLALICNNFNTEVIMVFMVTLCLHFLAAIRKTCALCEDLYPIFLRVEKCLKRRKTLKEKPFQTIKNTSHFLF